MILCAYLVVFAAFGFGAVWADVKKWPVLADWLGVAWLALLVLALLIL